MADRHVNGVHNNDQQQASSMKNIPFISSNNVSKVFFVAQILLRIIAACSTLAAAITMFTNKHSGTAFGLPIFAEYSYSPSFSFFAIANTVAFGYAALSLLAMMIHKSKSSTLGADQHFLMVLMDLMIVTLVMAACSAATAVAYIGKKGNAHSGWPAICPYLKEFCNQSGAAIFCSYIGLVAFFFLTIYSIKGSERRIIQVASS